MPLDFFGNSGFRIEDLLGWDFKPAGHPSVVPKDYPTLEVYFNGRPPVTYTDTDAEKAKKLFESAVKQKLTAAATSEPEPQQVEAEFYVSHHEVTVTQYKGSGKKILQAHVELAPSACEENKNFIETENSDRAGDRNSFVHLHLSSLEAAEFFKHGSRYQVTFQPVAQDSGGNA